MGFDPPGITRTVHESVPRRHPPTATVALETAAAQEVSARVRLELSRNPALKTPHTIEMLRDNRYISNRIDE